ncbi:hypothetical protein BGZ52_010653, partial [Haplosporangium bisporale]
HFSRLSMAQSIAHKFVKFLEDAATTNIWLPGRSKMVEWEKSRRIHAKAKYIEFSGDGILICDGGYVVHDGYFQCGALLTDNNSVTCPRCTNDPQVANKELFESLLGWRHLALIEWQEGSPYSNVS